jgi:DNA-binding MarR family transcriptional regulator
MQQTAPPAEQIEDAIVLYGHALGIVEPIRLRYLSELGLTLAHRRMLGTLAGQPGLSVRDLATSLKVTSSTVSQQIERLVRRGLVSRREDSADRRLLHHFLTEDGVQATEEVRRAAKERLRAVFSQLSADELDALIRTLRRLCEVADAASTASFEGAGG